ncbi:hypothetical protein ACINWC136_A0076, partial [Acinetobacter pittii]
MPFLLEVMTRLSGFSYACEVNMASNENRVEVQVGANTAELQRGM